MDMLMGVVMDMIMGMGVFCFAVAVCMIMGVGVAVAVAVFMAVGMNLFFRHNGPSFHALFKFFVHAANSTRVYPQNILSSVHWIHKVSSSFFLQEACRCAQAPLSDAYRSIPSIP